MSLSNWSDLCRVLAIVGSAVAVIATIFHFAIGKLIDRQKNQRIQQLESSVAEASNVIEATREYAEVAPLNLIGKPFPDGDLTWNTGISKDLEGSYKIEGTKVEFLKNDASERIYRNVIDKHPRFPFSYYALAWLLRDKGDPSWKEYANQCLMILEKTTKVAGHHPNHDQKLAEVKTFLAN